jgi:hypothetical protein
MRDRVQLLPDLLLLLSLLLVILMYPALDHGQIRRFVLGVLTFIPVLLATIRLSKSKRWVWPSILLMVAISIFGVASDFYSNAAIAGAKWGLLAAFFGLTVAGLFPYLKNALYVTNAHLYTAVSIYLLLGMLWFAIYCLIDVYFPGAILLRAVGTGRQANCCTSAWLLSRLSGTLTLCRLTVRFECWWHWKGSLVFFTSRFPWQYWSVPISKNESNNETPKTAVPYVFMFLRWLRATA